VKTWKLYAAMVSRFLGDFLLLAWRRWQFSLAVVVLAPLAILLCLIVSSVWICVRAAEYTIYAMLYFLARLIAWLPI